MSPNISDVNKGSGCFSIRSRCRRPGPLCDFLLTPQDSSSFYENPSVYKGMWDGMTVLPQNDLRFAEPGGLHILPHTGGRDRNVLPEGVCAVLLAMLSKEWAKGVRGAWPREWEGLSRVDRLTLYLGRTPLLGRL